MTQLSEEPLTATVAPAPGNPSGHSATANQSENKTASIPAVEPNLFRNVVGHFASGVTVITTRHDGIDYGATVSAMTSVSLDPPMLLICLNRRNGTQVGIQRSRIFAVNILGEEHGDLARLFATPGADKFRGVPTLCGALDIPLLADALAHVECRVVNEVEGGTHSVFIAEVHTASAREGRPLSYFRGTFGRFQRVDDDATYSILRTRVLARDLPVGDLLQIDDLAGQLGVPPATILDALAKLNAEGLLVREPQRGYRVRPIDAAAVINAFDARCAIELGVAELTIGTVAAVEVQELRRRAEATLPWIENSRFVDFDRYLESNQAFHDYLISLAHNDALLAAYRRLGIDGLIAATRGPRQETSDEVTHEHIRIVEAFEAADIAAARRLINEHKEVTKQLVLHGLRESGGIY